MPKNKFGFSWGTSSYTPVEKKGEINDLKNLLADPNIEKDLPRRRDLLKKVLAFMTLGVDTSALFTQMILACVTKDLVQKKMVYFYLCANSEGNSELAILAINTLQKDCRDESPLVRGLALRSLASFRLPQIAEYLVPTLKECLTDRAPYVRKTAILSSLRLFRVSPEAFRTMGLTDKMYGMLRDNDGVVVTNALAVLQEVLEDDGGVQINKKILYYLLNRLADRTEWQQVQILNLVMKYTPTDEEETFDVMNLLEERLRGHNSAVILACAHAFLHVTQNLPSVHGQVFDRLREPLTTLMATAPNNETAYGILCHLRLLVDREPKAFQPGYKDFFCRLSDPSYIKSIKMEILTAIANEKSAGDIVAEFKEYVADQNVHISKAAVAGMAKIALRVDSAAKPVLETFLELLDMDVDHIRGSTLVAMKDYLRKYSSIETVRPFLDHLIKSYQDLAFTDDDSRIALVWVLGEFGEHIKDAPYLLEDMLPTFTAESPALRIELMTTLMKLFFKRPPEVQPVLGKMFGISINDFSHADVHDRALLYYRLLRTNPQAASQVVCTMKESVNTFTEDDAADVRDRLFEEFDTMSIIYGRPSSLYLKQATAESESDEEEEEEDDEDDEDPEETAGLLAGENVPASSAASSVGGARPSQGLALDPDVELEGSQYQAQWGRLQTIGQTTLRLKAVPQMDTLEDMLADNNIFLVLSGQQGTTTKAYLYSKAANADTYFLTEMLISASCQAQVTMKSGAPQLGPAYQQHFQKAIGSLLA